MPTGHNRQGHISKPSSRDTTPSDDIHAPSKLARVLFTGRWPDWSPTARVQRRPIHLVYLVYLVGRTGNSSRRTRQTRKTSQPDRRTRARCASTGDQQTTLPSPSKLARNLSQRGGLVSPQLRASNEHIPIVRVPRARRTRAPAPSHPLRRIVLPRFFFCKPSIEGRQDHQRESR